MSESKQETDELVEVFSNVAALAQAAAQRFAHLAQEAVTARDVFSVALSGGSTPGQLYALMATDPGLRAFIPWPKIHFFFGDERFVPPDSRESNYRMVNEAMFQRLAPLQTNVHRVHTEQGDPARVADEYAADMAAFFRGHHLMAGGLPRFDLIILGMGTEGHTASLFPQTSALWERERWVVANWVEKFKTYRITLTLPVLNNAAEVIMFVAGTGKRLIVAETVKQTTGEPLYPVQMVHPISGVKRWMLDKAAAAQLPHE